MGGQGVCSQHIPFKDKHNLHNKKGAKQHDQDNGDEKIKLNVADVE